MIRRVVSALGAVVLFTSAATAQTVPTPQQAFGFEMGQDRKLADWNQLTAYYEKIAETSQRVRVDTLGKTTKGRPFVMLTITSPANQARLSELRDIQGKLADPRKISDDAELRRLLDQGRTVVMITHSIHATEVGGSQMAAHLVWRLATSDEPRIKEILDNVILLDIPSLNPDGLQWVVDWYRQGVGTPMEGGPLPWLYQFYTGHDNNRDWYAFTQDETVLTVKAQNAWHPQIVHDIHQMGATSARIFFPPYIDPWEPNVDPHLTTAVNQLGTWMAAEEEAAGNKGAVVSGQYDAFTPARAYMHYHAGARILSEAASVRVATPVDISADQLGPARGYDASQSSWNFPDPWPGGHWTLGDIVNYQETGAVALLTNAARNRPYWLQNFYDIGKHAVAKWDRWPEAWVIPANQTNVAGVQYVLRILTLADVEVHKASASFTADDIQFPAGSWVVPMHQPYASFAQAMLEVQHYPDLRAYPGGPPLRPYDVTAQTLPYLMDVEAVAVDEPVTAALSDPIPVQDFAFTLPAALRGANAPRVAIYKSWQEPIPEGWTRWVFDKYGMKYDTLHDADIRKGGLAGRYDVIVLQSQRAQSIRNGLRAGQVPPEYAGGLGDAGVAALGDFVQAGGRIVAVEDAVDFVKDLFELQVTNVVDGLASQDFYIPGSILRLQVDPASDIGRGVDAESIAWFSGSSQAFDVNDDRVKVLAHYGTGDPLLSGWELGGSYVAGKPAILEASVGKGSVVLFGFQPNYRGQSVATWPLLFNSLHR
jgi:murein tripeptide amidase MpaA